jgi:hypothetical protein
VRWDEPAPHEREAEERSWTVVRGAWEERIPLARRNAVRHRWPLVAFAAALAVLAATLSPPGMAVLGSIKDAVQGRDELLSLPAPGRILVNAPGGAWVVQHDGSKRLLSNYLDAAWSPHGLYLAAARGNELVALEPNGRIHWTLARARPIGLPLWSYEGYRIAYLSGASLRVVNGDGTGDRLIAARVNVTPVPSLAWRPGTHELAYADARRQIVLLDVDRNRVVWRRAVHGVERLLWSGDGRRLLAVSGRSTVFDDGGRPVASLPSTGSVVGSAFVPGAEDVTLAVDTHARSTVTVYRGPRYSSQRTIFSGPGVFGGIAWSPNARWLLVDWSDADQWIFVRVTSVPRAITISNINHSFGTGPESRASLGGWCCP